MDLATRLLYDFHRFYAWHSFNFAGIDFRDPRVRVGAPHEGAVKQAFRVVVVGVLGMASGFWQTVNASHAAADIVTLFRRWVAVLVEIWHHAPPFGEAALRSAIIVVPAFPFGSRPVI